MKNISKGLFSSPEEGGIKKPGNCAELYLTSLLTGVLHSTFIFYYLVKVAASFFQLPKALVAMAFAVATSMSPAMVMKVCSGLKCAP